MEVELFQMFCLNCLHYWASSCSYYDDPLEDIEKDSKNDFSICFTKVEED